MEENQFKEIIQSCHLNILVGSGCSVPFFETLGNVEKLLTDIEACDADEEVKEIAQASVVRKYFDSCISKNKSLLAARIPNTGQKVLSSYKSLISALNEIILQRRTSLVNKQVNVFTTNMDIFIERSLEELNIEFNDGFFGRIKPYFSLSNYKKSVFKTSAHYENMSELPLFNVFKIHGSVNWKIETDDKILLDDKMSIISKLQEFDLDSDALVDIAPKKTGKISYLDLEELLKKAEDIEHSDKYAEYLKLYEDLIIVNPNKNKFKFTTLNYTYYELLRMFSNELEKENSVLFVVGFSFADEHIREIVLRAANSNPTLLVCLFCYNESSEELIKENLRFETTKPKYNNLYFVPHKPKSEDSDEYFPYDLDNVNQFYFSKLADELSEK